MRSVPKPFRSRLVAAALVALTAGIGAIGFSGVPIAGAFETQCSPEGYWRVSNMVGSPGYGDRLISCDEPKPGWVFNLDTPGRDIKWVYDGDVVSTPTGPTGPVVQREVQEQGNKRPGVNQPGVVVYAADENNRAVRGPDFNYYREQLINGKWRRSGSYGYATEAYRKASWNAYYRSQGLPLVNPASGTFPSGLPPTDD
ncbi:MAG: hypothetical protein OXH07_05705 [Chloroflexi bacterium]|nr:hypothetical protein [Chloroflexota bacterium]